MARLPPDELEREWNEHGMPAKRAAGVFVEIIVYRSRARDPRWIGGESVIVKLHTPGGQHVGTVHEIRLPDGAVPHSHPKDYTRRDCTRVFTSR